MSTIVVFFVGQGTKLKCCSFKEVRHAICFFFIAVVDMYTIVGSVACYYVCGCR